MKNLQDVIFKAVNDNFDKKIRFIDVQSYYNFTEMLKLFTAILSDSFKSKQKPDDICIICVTYDNFRIARKLGYEAIYLYDFLDFTDEDYYLLKKFIPSFKASSISFSVVSSSSYQAKTI